MTQLVTNASPLFPTRVQVADANYTVTQTSGLLIAYTSLTAARVVNLPQSSLSPGQVILIVDETGNCSLTNTITITPNGTDSIDGFGGRILNYPYATITLENSGTGKWMITANPNPNLSAGMQVQPGFTDLGTGSFTLGTGTYALYTNSSGLGKVKAYSIAGNTFTPTDGVTSYVVASYNAGSPTLQLITDVTLITNTDVIPVFTIYRQGTTLHVFEWDQLGDALGNKMHKSIVRTQRYRAEPGGLGLGEAATRLVTLGSGVVWTGAVPTTLAAFNSSVNTLQFGYHVAGVWTFSTVTQYNNTQYDDGTNLQTTPGGKYVVNFVYRSVGTDTECFIILGNQAYTLGAAQASQPPGSLPPLITSHAVLVGRIIVQQGSTTATQIDSAFATLFTPTPAVDHNSLANLQGGTASQYYHLTSAEYTGTGTGNFVRANAPTVTGTWTFSAGASFGSTLNVTASGPSAGGMFIDYGSSSTFGILFRTLEGATATNQITAFGSASGLGSRSNTLEINPIASDFTIATGSGPTERLRVKNTGELISTSVIQHAIYTVATLPAGSEGMRAGVSDATAATFASIVAGGGANHVPVYFNGTNWIIG